MLKQVDGEWMVDPEVTPASFHGYSTVVRQRILEMPYKSGDAVERLCNELVKQFRDAGFKCAVDNKIAFGLIGHDGRTYYIGFKDWVMSLGMEAEKY